MAIGFRAIRLPFPSFFGAIFYYLHRSLLSIWRRFKQILFYEPMFRYRCKSVGRHLFFEDNFPLILGYGTIHIGDDVTIGRNVTLIASYKASPDPTIKIGDRVYLGYETFMSCADSISVGNRVLIAEGCSIYDNNNHPIDPDARAKNEPITKKDIAPVIIEDDVWIGANAIILKGVKIGRGSVVATGSIVTCDIPAMTVVAGNPAKIVKKISQM
jgi:acetyltransferase-like isoleucine patch superfamily enzyme